MKRDAALVLLDADAVVIGENAREPEALARRLEKRLVQASAMQADFREGMAREFAARLLVDELPEAIEEAAFAVLDAARQKLVGKAERREFAHAMGQHRDADAELLNLRSALIDFAGDAALGKIERELEAQMPP